MAVKNENEIGIEVSFLKRYNLGNYQHKEYAVKLNGTETQIHDQFAERKAKLQNLLEQIEILVDDAHVANLNKAEIVKQNAEKTVEKRVK